jgi:hypothetical protein
MLGDMIRLAGGLVVYSETSSVSFTIDPNNTVERCSTDRKARASVVRPSFVIDMVRDNALPDPTQYEWTRPVTPQKLRKLCDSISRWTTPNDDRNAVTLEREDLEKFTDDLIPTQDDRGMEVTYGSQVQTVVSHPRNSVDPLLSLLDG